MKRLLLTLCAAAMLSIANSALAGQRPRLLTPPTAYRPLLLEPRARVDSIWGRDSLRVRDSTWSDSTWRDSTERPRPKPTPKPRRPRPRAIYLG